MNRSRKLMNNNRVFSAIFHYVFKIEVFIANSCNNWIPQRVCMLQFDFKTLCTCSLKGGRITTSLQKNVQIRRESNQKK